MFNIKNIVKASIVDGVPYKPGKPIEELERELGIKNIEKLASNENACGTPEAAKKAIIECLDKLFLYPDGEAYNFKAAVAKHHGVDYKTVFAGNGSDELLQIIMDTFTDAGDNIVSSDHSFLRYGQMAKIANGEYRRAPMTADMRYDVKEILKLVDSHTKIIVLANPNNPTGTIIYDREARYLLDNISENVIVIFDEAYAGFVESPDYPDSLKLQNEYPDRPIVTLRSFSKIFGLAGARVGYGIANPEIVRYVNIVRGPFNINMLAQAAGCACFSALDHAEKSKKLCSDEKKYLYAEYSRLGVEFIPSEANFILIKIAERYDGKKMCDDLLKAGIIVRPMGTWGLSDNYMRVTIATHEQNARFITELKRLLVKPEMNANA